MTLHPDTLPAGGDVTLLYVRVPNERDDASTTKLQLQLPEGFAEASVQPVAGWTANVHHVKLATPIKTDDGELTEGVDVITWTATRQRHPGRRLPGLRPRHPGARQGRLDADLQGACRPTATAPSCAGSAPESSDNPAPTVRSWRRGTTRRPRHGADAAATPAGDRRAAGVTDGGGSSNGLAIVGADRRRARPDHRRRRRSRAARRSRVARGLGSLYVRRNSQMQIAAIDQREDRPDRRRRT